MTSSVKFVFRLLAILGTLQLPQSKDLVNQVGEELRAAQMSLKMAQDEVLRAERMHLDAEEKEARYRRLFEAGLVAKVEWRRHERAARETQALLNLAKDEENAAQDLVSALEKEYELARSNKIEPGFFSRTRLVSRYYGRAAWSSSELNQLDAAYQAKFGKPLPISALGQTATHDRFRFDHRDRIDVAISPDSVEGEWLLDYLRSRGIPFVAFRTSVPGEATGPHIHIGPPSSRL